jgi:hypothetical protein
MLHTGVQICTADLLAKAKLAFQWEAPAWLVNGNLNPITCFIYLATPSLLMC